MDTNQAARGALFFVEAFVAVTSILGGLALVVGTFLPDRSLAITPPSEYLAGSPFTSYLIPGLILAIVVGGLNVCAFVLLLRRRSLALFAAAVAGYSVQCWIFVQMALIPFSPLQAVYFAAGAVELGLVLLLLGLLPRSATSTTTTADSRYPHREGSSSRR